MAGLLSGCCSNRGSCNRRPLHRPAAWSAPTAWPQWLPVPGRRSLRFRFPSASSSRYSLVCLLLFSLFRGVFRFRPHQERRKRMPNFLESPLNFSAGVSAKDAGRFRLIWLKAKPAGEDVMSTAFTRTYRSLEGDSYGWTVCGVLAGCALAGGLALWCTLTPVTLYEVTPSARIEADQAVYPVAAPVAGRVKEAHLVIGRKIKEGEVLVELESGSEQLQVREQLSRQQALRTQIEALREQIRAEESARDQERHAAQSGHEEARAQAREAQASASHAESEEHRMRQLRELGLISEQNYQQANAEAQRSRAAAESRAIAVERSGQDQLTHESDRTARIRSLDSQIAGLESQIPTVGAAIERLQYEIERHRVRAPLDGTLGEAAVLRPGAVLKEGDKVGAIVPSGRLRAVAQFPPEAALGRIHPGQPARLRLDGFPWIQYGTPRARVARVASEIRDGTVRVELTIDPGSSRVPLQHGLPGSVEIEIDHATPWTLVMRHAGRQWTAPRPAKPEVL
ncbi:MAG: hypothetical protein C5B51_06985 [Terriglobia bacterium]|nr:MAG: hypothetical protein C5B51_06985 [Terriglobia bacterium]